MNEEAKGLSEEQFRELVAGKATDAPPSGLTHLPASTPDKEDLDQQIKEHRLDKDKKTFKLQQDEFQKLKILVCGWLAVVVTIVCINGCNGQSQPKYVTEIGGVKFLQMEQVRWLNLSDGVIIALITTTTVSVIGLFAIAAKWLFKGGEDADK